MGVRDSLTQVTRGRKERRVNLSDALICAQVYPHSPAEVAGLTSGGHLVAINSKPAAGYDSMTSFWPVLETYSYQFVNPDGQEILVESSLAEIGIRYEKTTPAIRSTYKPERHIYEELILLWERREWVLLKKLAAEQMHFFNETGWFMKKFASPKPSDTPASLLYGFALIELGQVSEGASFVEHFDQHELHKWTSDIHALSAHHEAKELVAKGLLEEARQISREAHSLYRFQTTVAWHRKLFNEEPPKTSSEDAWESDFPALALAPLDGKSPLLLDDFTAGTEPGVWNIFVCLGSYRGNGPYNELMATFRRNRELFKHVFSPILVITEEKERRADRPHWHTEEDELSRTKLPFRILHVEPGQLDLLEIEKSPEVFIVSRDLKVLYRGPMDGHNMWRALGRAIDREQRFSGLS